MDGTSLMSEKLIQQLHAQGVDPLRVPRFSVLRLRDDVAGGSLLEARLAVAVGPAVAAGSAGFAAGAGELAGLLWRHVAQVASPSLLPRLAELFGLAFLRGVTTFTLPACPRVRSRWPAPCSAGW